MSGSERKVAEQLTSFMEYSELLGKENTGLW